MQKIIAASQVSFAYGRNRILRDINFNLHKGDFTAVIGANGSGKSTLLKLLIGELTPTRGNIRLLGEDIRNFKQWPSIGYVPQNVTEAVNRFPATAGEIVLANMFSEIGLFRLPNKRHKQKAREALARVGMEAYAKRPVYSLSGGQRQRVMIARVLAAEPALMILDEPTSGVDPQAAEGIYRLLASLNREQNLTILIVTHDIVKVLHTANRTFCLEEGTMVELDSGQLHEELMHKHKHPRLAWRIEL